MCISRTEMRCVVRSMGNKLIGHLFFSFASLRNWTRIERIFFPSSFLFISSFILTLVDCSLEISSFLSFSRSIILSRKKMENNQFFERSGSSKKLDRRRKDRGNVDWKQNRWNFWRSQIFRGLLLAKWSRVSENNWSLFPRFVLKRKRITFGETKCCKYQRVYSDSNFFFTNPPPLKFPLCAPNRFRTRKGNVARHEQK